MVNRIWDETNEFIAQIFQFTGPGDFKIIVYFFQLENVYNPTLLAYSHTFLHVSDSRFRTLPLHLSNFNINSKCHVCGNRSTAFTAVNWKAFSLPFLSDAIRSTKFWRQWRLPGSHDMNSILVIDGFFRSISMALGSSNTENIIMQMITLEFDFCACTYVDRFDQDLR